MEENWIPDKPKINIYETLLKMKAEWKEPDFFLWKEIFEILDKSKGMVSNADLEEIDIKLTSISCSLSVLKNGVDFLKKKIGDKVGRSGFTPEFDKDFQKYNYFQRSFNGDHDLFFSPKREELIND